MLYTGAFLPLIFVTQISSWFTPFVFDVNPTDLMPSESLAGRAAQREFCRNGALKKIAQFKGKYLNWIYFLVKLQPWAKYFYTAILKNTSERLNAFGK